MRRNPSRVVAIRVPLEFRTTGVTSLGGPSSTAIPRTGPALSQSPMAFHRHRLRVRLMLTLPSTRATVVRTPPGDTASIGTSPACRTPSPKAGSKSSTVPHRLLIPCGTEVAQAILLLRRGIHQAINAVVLTASRGGRTEWRVGPRDRNFQRAPVSGPTLSAGATSAALSKLGTATSPPYSSDQASTLWTEKTPDAWGFTCRHMGLGRIFYFPANSTVDDVLRLCPLIHTDVASNGANSYILVMDSTCGVSSS